MSYKAPNVIAHSLFGLPFFGVGIATFILCITQGAVLWSFLGIGFVLYGLFEQRHLIYVFQLRKWLKENGCWVVGTVVDYYIENYGTAAIVVDIGKDEPLKVSTDGTRPSRFPIGSKVQVVYEIGNPSTNLLDKHYRP